MLFVCLFVALPPYQAFCMKHQEEAEVGGHEGAHHAELLHGGPHLIVERWTWYTSLIMLMMTMLFLRIISSPRQRQSTASLSVAGLLGLALQETWSKRSEAERSPLLFLISGVGTLAVYPLKMINSTWEDQAKHKDLVEDGNISLGASDS